MGILNFFSEKLRRHQVDADANVGHENMLLKRLEKVESDLAVDYHPVRTYLHKVRNQWDGETDYIGEFALVSLDEFEKIGRKKMPELKSMMQTLKPSFIGAYKKNFNQLPRIASFVGTTNERHVLTDRTGSRRFLILEPDGLINVDDICHDQLFLRYFSIPKSEGEGVFMSGKEIMRELEKHSKKTMEGVTPNSFGRSMSRLGVRRVGHHETDGYLVLTAA